MMVRTKALAVLVGVGMAGLVGAAAASLNVTNQSLGSSTSVTAACDADGITASYTTAYNATAQRYDVTAVVLTGVDALCNGKALGISLANGTTLLTSYSGTAATGTTTATLGTAVSAAAVDSISVVISG